MESSQFHRDILKYFKLFALLLLKNFAVDSSKFAEVKLPAICPHSHLKASTIKVSLLLKDNCEKVADGNLLKIL